MKKATIAAMLFALCCWAFPLSTAAQSLKPNAQTETKTEQVTTSTNADIHSSESTQPVGQPPKTTSLFRNNQRPKDGTDSGWNNVKAYTKEEVQALIVQYSQQYGISADLPLRVANCESGYNQFAKNKSSSASGVYQWLSSSWKNQPASQGGSVSVFDAEANISAAVWLIAHNQVSPWNSSRSCWNK